MGGQPHRRLVRYIHRLGLGRESGAHGGHRRTENSAGGPMAALGPQSLARTDCDNTLARITNVAKFMKGNF
jgi:hypothetical protein